MKTYPLNNADKSELESFKSAFESYNKAKLNGDTTFTNHAYNWLQGCWFDLGTGLRKSGFDVSNVSMMHDHQQIYDHILNLDLS